MAHYYNKRKSLKPILKEENSVYFLRRNLKIKRLNEKLNYKRIRLFKILQKTGPVNYRLELFKRNRIHPVFHISFLEPIFKNAGKTDNKELEA